MRHGIKLSLALLALATFAGSVSAADDIKAIPSEPGPSGDRPLECAPMGGVRYDSVTGITGSGCLLFHIKDPFAHRGASGLVRCSHTFLILQLEAGEDGGKLQFGLGELYMAGWLGKVSLLRTWNDPAGTDPDETYLGLEAQLNIFLLNTSIGLYANTRDAGDTLVTWSAGIGL
ncbi:MAG: hypothetical protein C0404_08590 [Verrucomicrobia bacterium]|nr:hypothetical protein [Verrucomicrobiota bacterium]